MPQRTPAQAYQQVLDSIDAGTVNPGIMWGMCQYRGDFEGKTLNCGVGCLFNKAQLDSIDAVGMNHFEIYDLAATVGEDNLVEVTGLSIDQLGDLQEMHDTSGDAAKFRLNVLRLMNRLRYADVTVVDR